MGIASWIAATLRQYPEIAIFLTLALGYYFGKFTFKGIGLGSVTATLLAGVIIGQLGITISAPLKATVFLMFLFAVGYGVGPQFVRGVAKDGLPQAMFSVVQCLLCLIAPVVIVKFAGYDLGYAAGLYSGSQTISAALGLSTDAINRLGLAAADARRLLDSMPIAYAVTYMFGTVGSAIVIALLGPALLRIDLVAACKDYEDKQGGAKKELGGAGMAWHRWEMRAFLSNACAATGLLRKPPRTRYCLRVTLCPSRALVRHSSASLANARRGWPPQGLATRSRSSPVKAPSKSTIPNCSAFRWKASTFT